MQYQGCIEVWGIRDQSGGIRDQTGGIWYRSPGIRDHKSWDREFHQWFFRGIRAQAVPFLWDQGPKFVTFLESGIRNLGTKIGSVIKKKNLVTTLQS